MGNELKWLLKDGDEHIFESYDDTSLKNTLTSHTQVV